MDLSDYLSLAAVTVAGISFMISFISSHRVTRAVELREKAMAHYQRSAVTLEQLKDDLSPLALHGIDPSGLQSSGVTNSQVRYLITYLFGIEAKLGLDDETIAQHLAHCTYCTRMFAQSETVVVYELIRPLIGSSVRIGLDRHLGLEPSEI